MMIHPQMETSNLPLLEGILTVCALIVVFYLLAVFVDAFHIDVTTGVISVLNSLNREETDQYVTLMH